MEWYFRRQLIQISPAEQIELIGKAQQGDLEATSMLLRSLYPLIIREVNKKYIPKDWIAEKEDLAQSAIEQVISAIPRFDKDKGAGVSTYLQYYIRLGINIALYDSTPAVQMGVARKEEANKIRAIIRGSGKNEVSLDFLNTLSCERDRPEDALEKKQRREAVKLLYSSLRSRQKLSALAKADMLGGYGRKIKGQEFSNIGLTAKKMNKAHESLRRFALTRLDSFSAMYGVI